MEFEFISVFWIGFILGLRHSVEADHVLTVSQLLPGASPRRALAMSMNWVSGHSTVLLAAGLAGLLGGYVLDEQTGRWFELVVALMLVSLGIGSLYQLLVNRGGLPRSSGPAKERRYGRLRLFAAGVLHGLAGSGALLGITFFVQSGTLQSFLGNVLSFTAGTALGMAIFVLLFFRLAGGLSPSRQAWSVFYSFVHVLSVVYGLYLFAAVINPA